MTLQELTVLRDAAEAKHREKLDVTRRGSWRKEDRPLKRY
jgi:hypothetical protein